MAIETWYVLEDGSVADPRDVTPDERGGLRHSSGAAVKLRSPGVPMTRSVDPDKERAKPRQPGLQLATREMTPAGDGQTYKTR